MPKAPRRKRNIFSFRVEISGLTNIPMIQKAMAANTHRRVTPERGLTHTGSRYFNAFMFNPLKVLETTILRLASTFLFFIIRGLFFYSRTTKEGDGKFGERRTIKSGAESRLRLFSFTLKTDFHPHAERRKSAGGRKRNRRCLQAKKVAGLF